jgi:GNAT superfamily N-acetyltransferase
MVRNATLGDLPQIKSLALRAWLHTYSGIIDEEEIYRENEKFYTVEFHTILLKRMTDGFHLFKILELNDLVCGLIDFDYDDDRTWLMRFYVSPELIGKGHGSALLKVAEKELLSLSRTEYRLMVHSRNKIGIGFYEKNGFLRDEKYDNFEDQEICYLKRSFA